MNDFHPEARKGNLGNMTDTYLELHHAVAKTRQAMRAEKPGLIRFLSGVIEPLAYRRHINRAWEAVQANTHHLGDHPYLTSGFVREAARFGKHSSVSGNILRGQQLADAALDKFRQLAGSGKDIVRVLSEKDPPQQLVNTITRDILFPELQPQSKGGVKVANVITEEKISRSAKKLLELAPGDFTQESARDFAEGLLIVAKTMREKGVVLRELKSPHMESAFNSILQRNLSEGQRKQLQRLVNISKKRAVVTPLLQARGGLLSIAGLANVIPLAPVGLVLAGAVGAAYSTYQRHHWEEAMQILDEGKGIEKRGIIPKLDVRRAKPDPNYRPQSLFGKIASRIALGSYIDLNYLDLMTTYKGLQLGAVEGNPVMSNIIEAHGFEGVIGYKALAVAAVVGGINMLLRRSKQSKNTSLRRIVYLTQAIATGMIAFTIGNNMLVDAASRGLLQRLLGQ